jgi:uracil-DNA glycosylase
MNCAHEFFKPLVDIIKPSAILALGKDVSESILKLYSINYPKNKKLSELMLQSPYQLTTSTVLLPLYHCGARGEKINRPMHDQIRDWIKVKKWFDKRQL